MRQLRRAIGFRDLLLFYIVTTFSLRWIATASASGPSAIVIWLIAAAGLFVPLVFATLELSSRYPEEGGVYRWSKRAFGPFSAFMTGWSYWTSNLPYFPSLLYFAAANTLFIGGGPKTVCSAQSLTSKACAFLAASLLSVSAVEAAGTMRIDYYHSGNTKEERFSLDRVLVEPLPWPGNIGQAIDRNNRGKYLFSVAVAATGQIVYSRGFSSIYGEWETTGEAQTMNRTFSESLRFPAMDVPAIITVRKRNAANTFVDVWSFGFDPKNKFVERGQRIEAGKLLALHQAGDPGQKLDLLILGDGYTATERGKFERDARRLTSVLFATSPFKEREGDINVWGLAPVSAQSGVSRPSQGIFRRSPLGTTYDAFDSERYILTFENKAFRDIAANAPYDVVEIITNTETYGGGGIFGLFSTAAADNVWAPYLFIHEFGHHLAGLADEYYTSDVAYLPATDRIEPWEPNVTALKDPANVKWKDLVTPGTALPTLWPQTEFEEYTRGIQARRRALRERNRPEAEINGLFREERLRHTTLLNTGPHAGRVGAFEGANYEAHGYYRSQADCVMFTRDDVGFCAVCRRAIGQILDLYGSH